MRKCLAYVPRNNAITQLTFCFPFGVVPTKDPPNLELYVLSRWDMIHDTGLTLLWELHREPFAMWLICLLLWIHVHNNSVWRESTHIRLYRSKFSFLIRCFCGALPYSLAGSCLWSNNNCVWSSYIGIHVPFCFWLWHPTYCITLQLPLPS